MNRHIAELAAYRLRARLNNGMTLSHDFVLKDHPDKNWVRTEGVWEGDRLVTGPRRAQFNYCESCKNWAWALGGTCRSKYLAAYQDILTELSDDLDA